MFNLEADEALDEVRSLQRGIEKGTGPTLGFVPDFSEIEIATE